MIDKNIEIGQEVSTKFRFYFTSLVFTLLAATIQTSNFDNLPVFIVYLELFSWIALVVSGLSSLSFLEGYTPIYNHFSVIDETKNNALKDKMQQSLKKLKKRMSIEYKVSKYGFIIGILTIIFARGGSAVLNL